MTRIQQTEIRELKLRSRMLMQDKKKNNRTAFPQWAEQTERSRGDGLLKNLAVASALVLCAVTLRTGTIPALHHASDVVLTAAADHSLLDEQLGKLSFVSAMFPEAVLVFGNSSAEKFHVPVSNSAVVHAWSNAEPYISWQTDSPKVTAASSGEVMGVYHGHGDERIVQILSSDGLSCLYGNLSQVFVKTGDTVNDGDVLGELMTGADLVLEVRKDGVNVDPAIYFPK